MHNDNKEKTKLVQQNCLDVFVPVAKINENTRGRGGRSRIMIIRYSEILDRTKSEERGCGWK